LLFGLIPPVPSFLMLEPFEPPVPEVEVGGLPEPLLFGWV